MHLSLLIEEIKNLKRLILQNQAIKIVARCHYQVSDNSFYSQFEILHIDDLWNTKYIAKFVYSFFYNGNLNLFSIIFLNPLNIHIELPDNILTDNTHLSISRYRATKLQTALNIREW